MNDVINGLFEALGGGLMWLDVYKLLKDKHVAGVYWPVRAFFMVWGYWNIYYYPSLDQWFSFWGGVTIVVANTVWVALAIKYRGNT